LTVSVRQVDIASNAAFTALRASSESRGTESAGGNLCKFWSAYRNSVKISAHPTKSYDKTEQSQIDHDQRHDGLVEENQHAGVTSKRPVSAIGPRYPVPLLGFAPCKHKCAP
jgi:hypothetical protein